MMLQYSKGYETFHFPWRRKLKRNILAKSFLDKEVFLGDNASDWFQGELVGWVGGGAFPKNTNSRDMLSTDSCLLISSI